MVLMDQQFGNNLTYSICKNCGYSVMLPIDFKIYEYTKTNEESIGFTATRRSFSTSQNDEYFFDEVPLSSEYYSNFEITYNIVLNIQLA